MPKSSKILLLAISAALVLTVLFGMRGNVVSAATEPQEGAFRQMNVYQEVLRHIQSDYVVAPSIPSVTNGALRGLLESLDADSSYLTAKDYAAFKADKGGKAQVGLVMSKRSGYAAVVSVVPGSPADKAGLIDSDVLENINGVDTRDLSLATIRIMLDGQPGSEVSVGVVRPRKVVPDKLTMSRVLVVEPPVSETLYENSSILYLKPITMDREHVQAIEMKLKAMQKAGQKKVLLDLRDVASGDYAEAVRMANFFLKSGTIASLEGQTVAKVTYAAEPAKTVDASGGLVVLVNRGTAGPGELVAAALADNKRAELVGERTFGEGAQQRTFELTDGAALILSVAKYETPAGKKLQDDAVTPAVLVAGVQDDQSAADGSDDGTGTKTEPVKPVTKPVAVDDQLNKGLELLKAKAA